MSGAGVSGGGTSPPGGGAGRPGFIAFPPIEAYGDMGFRIAGARVEGSVLIVNGAAAPWSAAAIEDVSAETLAPVLAADPSPEFLLLGAGPSLRRPSEAARAELRAAGLRLEVMDTGAACRVYATLIGEGRHIAAALIAVP